MHSPQTQSGSTLSLGLMFSESLALGLLLYAQKNQAFKNTLAEHVFPNEENLMVPTVPKSLPLLYPQSEEVALKRATWILKHGTSESHKILQEAIKDKPFESPKAVVLGITIGVLPIGVIGHDKPGKKVTVISLNTLADTSSLIQGGVRTSLNLLERSIQNAGGELKKIDPDMSDWFFGEKTLEFFKASRETIENMQQELSKLDVPYALVADEHGPITIAVSPAINPETLTLDWNLDEVSL